MLAKRVPSTDAGEDSWNWPNDASLSLEDVSRRKFGWRAVDTVNPNAWPAGVNYLARTAADALRSQEVRVARGYPKRRPSKRREA